MMLNLTRTHNLFRVVIATVVGALILAVSPWVPTANATTTPCSDDEVTVLIQGYPPACSPAGGTGYQTLINAGFAVEGTQRFPEFICRINSFPNASVDKCLTASPASAYWTYWHAPLGASNWTYSDMGAHGRSPQAGTVEAWTWGPGLEPGPVPVSRTAAVEETTSRSGSLRDSPMPTVPTMNWGPETRSNTPDGSVTPSQTASQEPEPEENPDNPDEVLVFLDSEGNRISRQDYEDLVAAAARAAATRTAPGINPQGAPGAPAPAAVPESAATETTAEEPDPKSTRMMTAPVLEAAPLVQSDGQTVIPQYDAAANAQGAEGSSQAWLIGVTVAFIILLGGGAAATWVLRREEVNG
ncbi:hypothetical protein CFAEC_02255 [Corynebacterium faecale]|uniref:oxidoreductase n=1 Tax=Corynebacterium faecale TaxID=1758466 RepID=UPI0025B33232|nr:oxidoreductase [Corynebacterium faecale]WJY91306.1 hypothetical protein CFAEC_02255 [Corynebacterium faecale]